MSDSEYAEPSGSEFMDQLEDMARQHCFTDKHVRTYHGVPEFNVTDSGGTSTDAETLRTLAKHGRFRIVREYGRMVVGYWPENDPNTKLTGGVPANLINPAARRARPQG